MISSLKLKIAENNHCYVRAKDFKMIANLIGHRLKITSIDTQDRSRTAYHGAKDAPELSLGVLVIMLIR